MLADKDVCIGCSACASVCPNEAITMHYNSEHFLFPEIDTKKCIHCGLCSDICPIISPNVALESHNLEIFSGHFTDINKTLQSSSGGFITALAEEVIRKNGVVYGVVYDFNFSKACYKRVDTIDGLNDMKGSKYIMSEILPETYADVKSDLLANREVLFVGCPCEVYALKNFLGKNYDNLLTCDLICQGGTTPKALSLFVKSIEEKFNSKTVYLNMRAKKAGRSNPYMMMMMMESGDSYFVPLGDTDFDVAFRNIKRPSCYNCHFKMPNNVGDFTAGDHIGMSEGDSCYHEAGVSIIFCHTMKGIQWINQLTEFSKMEETYERAAGIQACLKDNIQKPIYYEEFLKLMHSDGLAKAAEYVRDEKNICFYNAVKSLEKKSYNTELRLVIWGVGKYFEMTYEEVKRQFPNAVIVAIVDKYKTGERHGIRIITPEELIKHSFNHVLITTVAGQTEAIKTLSTIFDDTVEEFYTLVMLQSDIAHIK